MDEADLHAYLDGETELLSFPGPELHAHLEGCEACRGRLDEVRALRRRGRAVLRVGEIGASPPPPFEAIVARSRRGFSRRPWPRHAAAWAASLMLALAAGWLANEARNGPVAGMERPLASVEPAVQEASRTATGELAEEATPAASAAPGAARAPAGVPEGGTIRGEARSARDAVAASPPAPPPAATESAADAAAAAPAAAPPEPTPRVVLEEFAVASAGEVRRERIATPPALLLSVDEETRERARAVLGRDPALVPGLTLLEVAIEVEAGRERVVATQQLPGGEPLRLLQRRVEERPASARAAGERILVPTAPEPRIDRSTTRIVPGPLLVRATAPVPADSIAKLLEALQ